jgi:hypothetical protein
MNGTRIIPFLWLVFHSCSNTLAADAKIVKVLPHYLDLQGRHALSPSLYDRDAYQAHLRNHADQRSAIRFDVQWKSKAQASGQLKLRLEVRGSKTSTPAVFEQSVNRRGLFSQWAVLKVADDDYKNLGELIAWRATLWDDKKFLSERKSFLW